MVIENAIALWYTILVSNTKERLWTMTSLTIDLVALSIIIITVIISARRGFLSEVVSFVGWLVSAIVAKISCTIIADYIYINFIKDKIYSSVLASLEEKTVSISSSYSDFISSLPEAIQKLLGNADLSNLNAIFEDPSRSAETVALEFSDSIIGPIITTILTALAFILVFLLCLFIVKLLSKLFKGIRKIPVIGPLNTFLGILIGIIKALIILYLIKMIVEFVLTSAGGNLFGISVNDFSKSYILKILNFDFRGLI